MDINKLNIDKSLKKKLIFTLNEFEDSKTIDDENKSKSFLQKIFS